MNAKSKSEKFPPPHQDGALGFPLGSSHAHHVDPPFDPPDIPFSSTFVYQKGQMPTWSGPLVEHATAGHPRRKKQAAGDARVPGHPRASSHSVKETQMDKGGIWVK